MSDYRIVNVPSIWTEEAKKELSRLWSAGMPASEIGLKLGTTKNAVIGKVHRMGLPSRRSAPIVSSRKREMLAPPALGRVRLDADERRVLARQGGVAKLRG